MSVKILSRKRTSDDGGSRRNRQTGTGGRLRESRQFLAFSQQPCTAARDLLLRVVHDQSKLCARCWTARQACLAQAHSYDIEAALTTKEKQLMTKNKCLTLWRTAFPNDTSENRVGSRTEETRLRASIASSRIRTQLQGRDQRTPSKIVLLPLLLVHQQKYTSKNFPHGWRTALSPPGLLLLSRSIFFPFNSIF